MRIIRRKILADKAFFFRVKQWVGLAVIGFTLFACSLSSQQKTPTQQIPIADTPTNAPTSTNSEEGSEDSKEETPSEVSPTSLPEASIPNSGYYTWRLVADGLNQPVDLVHAGDNTDRIFVVEKRGVIWVFQDDIKLGEPFLDIRGRIESGDYERGLLGLAFHPNYAENGFFYVNYTDKEGDTTVSRFQVTSDPNLANSDSEFIILQVDQPYANHNGGDLAFGPDGYIYIGLGDGGSGGDPQGNAQNYLTLLGKMLRIDVNVDEGIPYAIPSDNPFVAFSSRLGQIWASGLRNPWRYSFDRLTGDLYIGDVGQNQWEEINLLPAGSLGGVNFGWNYFEGFHSYEGSPTEGTTLIDPILEYDHSGGSCSVTGGYVYRGESLPEWFGVYIYGDFCSGLVWGAVQQADGSWQSELLFTSPYLISSFGEDEDGELYLVDLNGAIYRLENK